MEGTTGVMPVMDINGHNDVGTMGGGWLWIVFLFFLIAWGGNGFFGNRGEYNQISNDFLYTNLKNTMDNGFVQNANQNFQIQRDIGQQTLVTEQAINGLNNNLTNLGYGIQSAIAENRYAVQNGLCENRYASQQCCCETNRNIDNVRYEMSQNTCSINANATANTQKILDKLCQMESNAKDAQIAQLQMELQAAQLTLGNNNQTQTIINSLLPPRPVPAYVINGYPYCHNFQQA